MSIPLIVGGLTAVTAGLVRLSILRRSDDFNVSVVAVQSAFFGVSIGTMLWISSEPVTITGTFQDKQAEQHFLSSATIALIKTNDVTQQIRLPGVAGLGLKEGDAVKVSGDQYLMLPSLRDFHAIDKAK